MKAKRVLSLVLSAVLALGALGGCASGATSSSEDESVSVPVLEMKPPSEESASEKNEGAASEESSDPVNSEKQGAVRLAALKGPTSMGLVKLLSDAEAGQSQNKYDFSMTGSADEIVARIAKDDLDIAAVPCNLASVLYNNTQGKVRVAAINTLGVLYIVETGDEIHSLEDLRGKTLYTTGKGTTPEYALNYVLSQSGIDPEKDLTIEYKSEATEVAAQMATSDHAIAMLPEPFVTTAAGKNEKLRTALSLTEEWDKVGGGSTLVTGVVIVRSDFLDSSQEAVNTFLDEYRASIDYVNNQTTDAAMLVEKYDIAPAAVAEKALPLCNIRYIDSEEMKTKVSGYLQTLFDQNPKAVGGKMPDDAFYYQK